MYQLHSVRSRGSELTSECVSQGEKIHCQAQPKAQMSKLISVLHFSLLSISTHGSTHEELVSDELWVQFFLHTFLSQRKKERKKKRGKKKILSLNCWVSSLAAAGDSDGCFSPR